MRVALGIAAAVAAVVAVVLAAGVLGDPEPAAAAGDPHAGVGTVDADKVARVLRAAEAASTATLPRGARGRGPAAVPLDRDGQGRRVVPELPHRRRRHERRARHDRPSPARRATSRGPRDVPSLWGVADTPPYGWAGQEETLEAFVVGTIETHFKGGDRQPVAKTAEQVAALVAYLETLEPPASPFDQRHAVARPPGAARSSSRARAAASTATPARS